MLIFTLNSVKMTDWGQTYVQLPDTVLNSPQQPPKGIYNKKKN